MKTCCYREWLPLPSNKFNPGFYTYREWLPLPSNKFNPGFFHNEIRERSHLATKFVTKNGPESHWNRPKYLPNWSPGATWGRLGAPRASKLKKHEKSAKLWPHFWSQNRPEITKNRKMSIQKSNWFRVVIFDWFFMDLASQNGSKFDVFFNFNEKRRFCKN